MLVMKPPHSDEDARRMCGLLSNARAKGMEVSVYLLGDGVYCAKKGHRGIVGESLRSALSKGAEINASKKDLLSRAIGEADVETGVKVLEDLEGAFVEDIMERSTRVASW
jgi:sulfur relay protein TusB/DsrH